MINIFLCPHYFNGGGIKYHPCPYVPSRTKTSSCVISFEHIGVLDSFFILRYTVIKDWSSWIYPLLLTELWPSVSELTSAQYLENELMELDKNLYMY